MKRLLLVPAILLATTGTASAEERTITLDEAISLATGDNFQVDLGKEKVTMAKEDKAATKTLRLPSLGIRANLFMWDSKIDAEFAPMTPPITIRNQVTGDVTVSVFESLTGLSVLGRLIDGKQAAVDQASAELDVTKLDLAFQVTSLYLQALQLQTLREVAATSVTQIEADLVNIRALRDAKVLSDLDVLRLEATRDQTKAQLLESEANLENAIDALAVLIDLPEGTPLALAPIDTTPPAIGWTEDEAVAAAKNQRPELRAAAAVVEQSAVGVDVVKAEYLPSVNALATYTHSEQGGPFQIKDSAFVGLQLEWNLWDWGKRKHELRKARAMHRSAKRVHEELEDAMALDVRTKWNTASTQKETLAVHESALKAAEEAYRLQTVKIQGGVATSTDVIDAETEVARARAQATVARYQYLISWMALVRAVGQIPETPGAK